MKTPNWHPRRAAEAHGARAAGLTGRLRLRLVDRGPFGAGAGGPMCAGKRNVRREADRPAESAPSSETESAAT
jgi:hypothetical protein